MFARVLYAFASQTLVNRTSFPGAEFGGYHIPNVQQQTIDPPHLRLAIAIEFSLAMCKHLSPRVTALADEPAVLAIRNPRWMYSTGLSRAVGPPA